MPTNVCASCAQRGFLKQHVLFAIHQLRSRRLEALEVAIHHELLFVAAAAVLAARRAQHACAVHAYARAPGEAWPPLVEAITRTARASVGDDDDGSRSEHMLLARLARASAARAAASGASALPAAFRIVAARPAT